MDAIESVKMAVKTLTANKLRSSLTMLGMIIGNASVISMIGIGQGMQSLASEQFESLGPNVLFISPGTRAARNRTFDRPNNLVLADADAIAAQVPTIKGVTPQLQAQLTISFKSFNKSALIVGTTPSFLPVRSFEVAKGRFISNLDVERSTQVVTLGSELAESLFGNTNPIGQRIRMKGISFEVIGVMQAKGSFLGQSQDDAAYLPITTTASRIVGRSSPFGIPVTFISIAAASSASIPAAEFQVTNLLRLRHKIVDEDDFVVQTQKDILSIVGTITGALTILLAAIASISLLVGGIGIMNIMLVSVTERTQEIGLRKAIGAGANDIMVQFMIEAVILSAIGGILGTLVGCGGILLVGALSPLTPVISPAAVTLAVGVSGGIGLFFGVVPARRAAGLDPIVALRSA